MIELTPPTLTIHLILQILTRHKSIFMCVCVCMLLSSQKYVSFNYKY